jgi:phosphohistidine phosphatase SixA
MRLSAPPVAEGEDVMRCHRKLHRIVSGVALLWTAVLLYGPVSAQAPLLSGPAFVDALKKGGYVIVLRHASSPRELPDDRTANPDNTPRERQLDETGRKDATALGQALRRLAIPVGRVVTSPTYRARETVRFAQLPKPEEAAELGDRGRSMQGVTEADGAWLRTRAAQFSSGSNTFLVTHLPNIMRAFPEHAADVGDGDALVFGPDGKGGATLVAFVKIAQWHAF